MTPTIQQLDCWLDAHNMEAWFYPENVVVELIKNDDVSHHIQTERMAGESDVDLLGRACAIMARDCCLVPPLVALHLNHSPSSGARVAGADHTDPTD